MKYKPRFGKVTNEKFLRKNCKMKIKRTSSRLKCLVEPLLMLF